MKILRQLRFIPTYACNLRCKYCYLGRKRKRASQADFSGVVPAASKLAGKIVASDYRFRESTLHGAEATTMSPEMLADVLNALAPALIENGCSCLQTNGINLTAEYMKRVNERLIPSTSLRFSVSLDGPEDMTDRYRGRGTYRRVIENIYRLKDEGHRVGLIGVVSSETMDHLDEMDIWISRIRHDGFDWQCQFAVGDCRLCDSQQIQFAQWMFERNWHFCPRETDLRACSAQGNACAMNMFEVSGEVPCCTRSGESIPLKWFDASFEDIVDTRKNWFLDREISHRCRYCPAWNACHGGCPTNRINGVASECAYIKTIWNLEADRHGVSVPEAIARQHRFLWRKG